MMWNRLNDASSAGKKANKLQWSWQMSVSKLRIPRIINFASAHEERREKKPKQPADQSA